jgi:hypothetical protein
VTKKKLVVEFDAPLHDIPARRAIRDNLDAAIAANLRGLGDGE